MPIIWRGHVLSGRRLDFLLPKVYAPESIPKRRCPCQRQDTIKIIGMLGLDLEGRPKGHEQMSLILVILHNMIEEIILPCLRDALCLRGKEHQITTARSPVHDF
jgi:hypothetical protein